MGGFTLPPGAPPKPLARGRLEQSLSSSSSPHFRAGGGRGLLLVYPAVRVFNPTARGGRIMNRASLRNSCLSLPFLEPSATHVPRGGKESSQTYIPVHYCTGSPTHMGIGTSCGMPQEGSAPIYMGPRGCLFATLGDIPNAGRGY